MRIEIAVARGQRQTVGGTQGLAGDDLDRQGKLLHHAPDDHDLLVVFFAKHCDATRLAGVDAGKQLHHHGADANKKAGAKVPFEDVGQLGRWVDLAGLRLGIEIFFPGRKQHIAAGGLQLVAVGLPGAGVGIKVFVRRKLQTVHKNAGHRHVTERPGLIDEPDVALVQIAHGGHEGGALVGTQVGAQVGNGVNDFHVSAMRGRAKGRIYSDTARAPGYHAWMASTGKRPSLTART